uniref:Uncharacterized protein n=1 Tax=Anopheles dirus TaxID=7168 RepID=A0A182NW43_9DIPT
MCGCRVRVCASERVLVERSGAINPTRPVVERRRAEQSVQSVKRAV